MKTERWAQVVLWGFAMIGLTFLLAWLGGVYPFESEETKRRRAWEERMGIPGEIHHWEP